MHQLCGGEIHGGRRPNNMSGMHRGEIQASAGGTAAPCGAGTYQAQNLQSTCVACARQFQLKRKSSCKNCEAGKATASTGKLRAPAARKDSTKMAPGPSNARNAAREPCVERRVQGLRGLRRWALRKERPVARTPARVATFARPVPSMSRGLWEGFYCPAGTTAKKPIGGNRGKPVGGNPAACDGGSARPARPA